MRRSLIISMIVLMGCASPLVEQLKVDIKYGRIDDAIEHGREAAEKEPDNPVVHLLLGQAYIHASRWVDATSELDEAIRLDSVLVVTKMEEDPDFYWTTYYNAGIEFMKEEDYQQASRLFIRAIGIDPSEPRAYNNLGFTYLMLGDEQKMIENYIKATDIDSTNVDAYYNLGFYHANHGDYDVALDYVQKAEKLGVPELEKYTKEFFKLFTRELGPAEREEYLERLISAEESQRKEILASELNAEVVDRALRILDGIEKRTGRVAEILSTQGLIYVNTEKEAEAEDVLKRALMYSKDDSDTYFYLILALQRQEKYGDALPYLEKMAEIDPSDIRAWFQLGVSHFRTENCDEALEAFTKAIELNPSYPDAYTNRGNVYAKKADLMKAKGKKQEERELRELAKQDFQKADALEKTRESE